MTALVQIPLRRLAHGVGLPLPTYMTPGAAGMDLYAAHTAHLAVGARALVPTGFCLAIPPGYEGQIRPRSGLAYGYGLTVLNAPGTIDSDYRLEVKVLLINLGESPFEITKAMRIAQLVIAPIALSQLTEEASFQHDESRQESRQGGFGSTGLV